jgi:hypothetical protein
MFSFDLWGISFECRSGVMALQRRYAYYLPSYIHLDV